MLRFCHLSTFENYPLRELRNKTLNPLINTEEYSGEKCEGQLIDK